MAAVNGPATVHFEYVLWAAVKALLDAVPETAAPPAIEKYTGVLAAADVYTAHTAYGFSSRSASPAGSGSTFAPEHDRGRR